MTDDIVILEDFAEQAVKAKQIKLERCPLCEGRRRQVGQLTELWGHVCWGCAGWGFVNSASQMMRGPCAPHPSAGWV